MAIERSNKDRVQQVAEWLRATFPTPYPTIVKTPKRIPLAKGESSASLGGLGETYREDRQIVIRVAVRPGIPRYVLVDTLLHEWGHAMTMRQSSIEDTRLAHGAHDEEWGLAYSRIYRRFIDEAGDIVSGDY